MPAIVADLRSGRESIRSAWAEEVARRGFARLLAPEEAEADSARTYDALIECLETGRYHSAQAYAPADDVLLVARCEQDRDDDQER